MRIETFFMLTMAFIINIFAVVIFANFSDTADPDSIGLESAGSLIGETFGNTVCGEGKRVHHCHPQMCGVREIAFPSLHNVLIPGFADTLCNPRASLLRS